MSYVVLFIEDLGAAADQVEQQNWQKGLCNSGCQCLQGQKSLGSKCLPPPLFSEVSSLRTS